jgi:hypothetical protein
MSVRIIPVLVRWRYASNRSDVYQLPLHCLNLFSDAVLDQRFANSRSGAGEMFGFLHFHLAPKLPLARRRRRGLGGERSCCRRADRQVEDRLVEVALAPLAFRLPMLGGGTSGFAVENGAEIMGFGACPNG